MESGAKALRPTYLNLQQQHINLDHPARDNSGAICIEQQLVDRLEQIKNRVDYAEEHCACLTPAKNLSQHCTLRYDASCPGDAPLCLKCSEVCIVLDAPSLPASNDGA